MLQRQNGSATTLAIMVMLVLGIMGSGLLPWISNTTRTLPMSRDALEAEYAAEAGAKRAIVEFNKVNISQTPDWSWLNLDRALTNDATKESYKVIIYISSDSTRTPVTPSFSSNNTYTIQSTGTVGNAKKTISVDVAVNGSGGSGNGNPPTTPAMASDAAIYAGNQLEMKNNAAINGASIASGGTITAGNNLHVANPYGAYANQSLALPQFSAQTFQSSPSLESNSTTLNGGKYYINGNWTINNNATISGDGIIFVNGNITFPQNVNFTGKVLIISTGNMDASNSNNVNFSSGVLISYGNIEMKNNFNLTGSVMAAKNISFKNNVNITYSSSILNSFGISTTNGSGQASTSVQTGSWQNG